MLPKKNRASRKDVEQIFKAGRSLSSQNLSFRFIFKKSSADKKVSFVVPKNVSKNATRRNFLRRRGYTVLRECFSDFPPGVTGVFVFKKPETSVLALEEDIKVILNKI